MALLDMLAGELLGTKSAGELSKSAGASDDYVTKAFPYDFNPISAEQKAEAMAEYGDTMVYWTPFGKVYHTDVDCHAMNRTDTITEGTVEQAITANRTRVCSYREKRDAEALENRESE